MKRHVIKFEEIKGYTTEIELVGSHGRGENKSLYACITFSNKDIVFKIVDNGEIVTTEENLEKSILIYNEL